MMSNVSENGPAFLLRMRLVSSASIMAVLRSADIDKLRANHVFVRLGQRNVVHVEPIDGPAVDVRWIVQTREPRDGALPFGDRCMQERLPADLRKLRSERL